MANQTVDATTASPIEPSELKAIRDNSPALGTLVQQINDGLKASANRGESPATYSLETRNEGQWLALVSMFAKVHDVSPTELGRGSYRLIVKERF